MWPVTSKNLICSESIVINYAISRVNHLWRRIGGDRADLVNTKHSELDGSRLVLFKQLKEAIVDIPTPLVCECTDDKIDVSWQLSLHPTKCLDHLWWHELAWGTHIGIDPTGPLPSASCLASLPS